jgi:hypothetical protein
VDVTQKEIEAFRLTLAQYREWERKWRKDGEPIAWGAHQDEFRRELVLQWCARMIEKAAP